MTNKTLPKTLENSENPSEEALLAEYEVCQHEASATGSYTWQSGIIFFVTTLTLAGAVISHFINADSTLYRLLLIVILGAFSIAVLCAWKKYASRQQFIRNIIFDRMETIEKQKGLRKNLYVRFLDGAKEDDWKTEKWLPLEETERKTLWEKYRKDPGRKPRGFKWVHWIAWSAIIAWAILVLLEILRYSWPSFRSWLN